MSERLTAVVRALTDAPADAIVDSLAEVLAKEFAVAEVELYLVDYRLTALLPLFTGPAAVRPGDPAWRSFDHQSEVTAGQAVFLPVTSRGERIGVLRCAPVPGDERLRAELAVAATVLAHELQSATVGTDRYTSAARARRLTLAAEMQWELLPGRSRVRPSFSLAGQLEPSYAVRGDGFDWAEQDGRLFLSVLGGMGEGMSAALLTSLATYALRNARRAGLDLADQAALADQAIFAQHTGAAHVAALLLELDTRTGELMVVDAGSPNLMTLHDGTLRDRHPEEQFPLGMFEASDYRAERMSLRPGERLIIVSDGIVEAATEAGRYGEVALHRFVRRSAAMAPLQAVRTLLSDLRTYLGEADLEDDAVVVCLDWNGPDGSES
ncbi:PP2C family protein-serine/threonine phosphatase [Mangrovihabitans endophyticus]|uniref:Phosphatase n=1 Tax=Mangrovihabitans endophyticus TaxID=1751298 RepID=A0A8J3C1P0_9ACTN|nr:PP2C family protein-serine/threonine phosphatase [Mangrovihabitans endophyticus]GGL02348.1 phosphatase [Mangrovihabitans endophyticus]